MSCLACSMQLLRILLLSVFAARAKTAPGYCANMVHGCKSFCLFGDLTIQVANHSIAISEAPNSGASPPPGACTGHPTLLHASESLPVSCLSLVDTAVYSALAPTVSGGIAKQ